MKQLIIQGDPGIRKDAVISIDGEEVVCFGINRMGEWHGPDRVQLWCTVGSEDEREAFDLRSYIPHFLDVEHYDAADVSVLESAA